MQERRLRLERALMGDLTRQQIDIFVPGSRDDPFDVEEWAEDLAWLLLPRGIELFPRQRWCNSVKTMSEYGLLGACHQLLERAGYLWIMALQGKDLPARVDMDMEEGSTDSDWELSPDEGSQAEEGEAAGQQVVPPDQEPHHGAEHLGKDWAEFNRRQRGGAKAFILSQPRYALVISSIVLGLSTHMLHVIENIGSQRYDMAQWYRMLNGESGVSRMVEAFKGRLGDSTVERARCLLNEQGPWHALPPGGRTWAMSSIAFTEISTMLCGLEQLQFRFWRTFPFRLVEVLLDPKEEVAKRILDVPLCLLDEFSRRFLNRFQTPARLLSRQARGVIASLASIVRLDIIRLECKNAQIKRLMRARASTHAAEFGYVSADFILQQQCILEQRLQQQQGETRTRTQPCRSRRHARFARRASSRAGRLEAEERSDVSSPSFCKKHECQCRPKSSVAWLFRQPTSTTGMSGIQAGCNGLAFEKKAGQAQFHIAGLVMLSVGGGSNTRCCMLTAGRGSSISTSHSWTVQQLRRLLFCMAIQSLQRLLQRGRSVPNRRQRRQRTTEAPSLPGHPMPRRGCHRHL